MPPLELFAPPLELAVLASGSFRAATAGSFCAALEVAELSR